MHSEKFPSKHRIFYSQYVDCIPEINSLEFWKQANLMHLCIDSLGVTVNDQIGYLPASNISINLDFKKFLK